MNTHAKKLFVKTYGCQMNVYDSGRMADTLSPHGYIETSSMADADVILLNTCHIREKAAEKVYSELGRIRQIKQERERRGASTLIAVAGCVAQAEGEEIIDRAPVVDLVLGPQSYHLLPELIGQVRESQRPVVHTDFPEEDKFKHLPVAARKRASTAFVTVQEGCDKFCSFCVVPYTRGLEYSRPGLEILDEVQHLVEGGVREITLLGQNVNAYHGQGIGADAWSLADLIHCLAKVDGLERLRYTTSHPCDMTDDLISAHRDVDKLMPYLHLPFQAGADRILSAMNRRHSRDFYLRVIDKIRDARLDLALSTDIIVGFPSETEEEFSETLDLVREVKFAQAYSFKYSARPGTPGATMDGQVPEGVKSERLQRLQNLVNEQQRTFNCNCVGVTLPVLFEKEGRQEGQLVGRSPYLQPVHADAPTDLIGRIMDVEILAAQSNSLSGVIKTGKNAVMDAHVLS